MLSPEERAEIDSDLGHYPNRRAACIEALKAVQRHRRWISDAALADVAEALGLSTAELDGVATFYNQLYRKPVGKRVILLCDSLTCWMLGYPEIRAELEKRLGCGLGGTSADGEFTLIPTQCLGCCDRAPALMMGDELHTHVGPSEAARLLRLDS